MDLLNLGSLLMMLAMVGVVIFMGTTGRLATLAPAPPLRELTATREELDQVKKDNEDLRVDNQSLHHTVRVLSAQGAEQTHRNLQLEAEVAALRTERDGLLRRNTALEAAFESRLGTSAAATPNQRLREVLAGNFSEPELKQLCLELQIDLENIEGEGKTAKAQNLVAYFERRGELALLTAAVRRSRPNARL